MYFGIVPKIRKEDLFDFEEEYSELLKAIKGEHRLIVIKGLRRTGKTSLMNVVYNQIKNPRLFVDAREIPVGKKMTYIHFGRLFYEFLSNISMKEKIGSLVTGLDAYIQINFQRKPALSELAKRINEVMRSRNEFFCLFIDEAQMLKPSGFDRFLAFLYDRTDRIKIILAGSEVGLMDKFIGLEAQDPLYGRVKKIIEIKKFQTEKSMEFLRSGFREKGMEYNEDELKEAVSKLDGIVGWLAAYGFYRTEMSHETALKKTMTEGTKMVSSEIERFLSTRSGGRKRYLSILKLLSKTSAKWSEIKNLAAAKTGKAIPDSRLAAVLDQLLEYGFIEKKEGMYYLADPLIAEAVATKR